MRDTTLAHANDEYFISFLMIGWEPHGVSLHLEKAVISGKDVARKKHQYLGPSYKKQC